MNLIEDPVFTINGRAQASLPALFTRMVKCEVRGFPALRPHQRPAWHMFLVQLGALAAQAARYDELPDDAAAWASALRGLTPAYPDDEPWQLVVEDRGKPAFLQPPDPGNLKWSPVPTPDALDLLITSRNHDLKKAVARKATPEDWVFALVSLQTCEGYGGGAGGYPGIARMNGGHSSRPMLGLAPSKIGDLSVDPSAWWHRDTLRLISDRKPGENLPIGVVGGPSLLWCRDWPEGSPLDLRDLDPWFIEVCRRIRLTSSDDGIQAERATSKGARIQMAKALKGKVPDPWTPVRKADAKALTLSSRDFDYVLLCDLLFSGNWKVPELARYAICDGDNMLLVAEALSRGENKTEGFKSRVINVPREALRFMQSESASSLSKAQMEEVAAFDSALRSALALIAANGDHNRLADKKDKKRCYAKTESASREFNRAADRIFFPNLWRRLAVAGKSPEAESEAKCEFLDELRKSAESILEAALPGMPCAAIYRPRAEARARRSFVGTLRRNPACGELFNTEETNVAT